MSRKGREFSVLLVSNSVPLLIFEDWIYHFQLGRIPCFRKVCSVRACLKECVQNFSFLDSSMKSKGVLESVQVLKFCLFNLIPYLAAIAGVDPVDLNKANVYPMIRDLEHIILAESSFWSLHKIPKDFLPLSVFNDCLFIPSIISKGSLYPLQPIPESLATGEDIRFQGIPFRKRLRLRQPLNTVMMEVKRNISQQMNVHFASLSKRIQAVLGCRFDQFVMRFSQCKQKHWTVLYKDEIHQILYANGNFLLVRGPVKKRLSASPLQELYLTLPICSDKRKTLSVNPSLVEKDAFFPGMKGRVTKNNICMGNRLQYHHLFSDLFNAQEAMVHWLDAAVDITSGVRVRNRELDRLRHLILSAHERRIS